MPDGDTPIDYAALIQQAPDAVILSDLDGVIRLWNAAATRVFGHTAEAAIGASLDLIVPERFREAHWAGFHRAVAAGETKYAGQVLPTRIDREGQRAYVELTFAIVHDTTGAVSGVLAHARDITERFERDRQQTARLAELEAQAKPASP